MASRADKRLETEIEKSQLSKRDIRLLLIVYELVNFCAKLLEKSVLLLLCLYTQGMRYSQRTRLNCNSFETFTSLD